MVLIITAYATVETAVAAFRRGAHDYLMKPVLFDDLLVKLDRLMRFRRLTLENQALRRQLHAPVEISTLVGESPPMREVKTLIRKLGPTRSNVLITGESGTGKELVARALHAQGREPDAPFLAINCAAIPHDLLESQLFGHVRGSFTGADRDRAGLFVAAGRGTVFLDEIGELAPATQAKLLRAIEAKEVLPVGATRPEAVAARVVAATNKDLDRRGRRRPVPRRPVLPAQRRRHPAPAAPRPSRRHPRPDRRPARPPRPGLGKRIDGVDNAAVRLLTAAAWKGNVRELGNALERAVILAEGPTLTPADFPGDLAAAAPSPLEAGDDLRLALDRFERQHLARVLQASAGDKREAARRLGLGLSSLYRKLEDPAPRDA